MNRHSLNNTINDIDSIIADITNAGKTNDRMFRDVCHGMIYESYQKLQFHNNINTGATMAGHGIGDLIQMCRGKYKNGSFAKAVRKTESKTRLDEHKFRKINQYIRDADFDSVVKLVKITHKHGLKEAYRFVFSLC